MGVMDAFNPEDRVEIKISSLYTILREAAKCELLMNAVYCDVPNECIRAMATGIVVDEAIKSEDYAG